MSEPLVRSILADLDRYAPPSWRNRLVFLLTAQGVWVTVQYRVSRWVHLRVHVPGLRLLLKSLCFLWRKVIEVLTHCELPNRAEIGPGLHLPHAYGIVVHTDARIGGGCNIGNHVTIGLGGRPPRQAAPVIGARVFIGPGARVLGAVRVGDDAAIGANAVVTRDVPDQAVAVGIPARVVSLAGSHGLLNPHAAAPAASAPPPADRERYG